MKTTLDQGGWLELPTVVQVGLGVKPGDELSFEQQAGQWIIRSGAASSDDDLDWAELDYESLTPRRVGEVAVVFEQRGRLKPMPISEPSIAC